MNVKFQFSESSISTPEKEGVTEFSTKVLQHCENMTLDSSVDACTQDQLVAAVKDQQLVYVDFQDSKSSLDCMEDFFAFESCVTSNSSDQKM